MTMEEDFIAGLLQEYIQSIDCKITLLESLLNRIQKNPTKENIQAFRMEIHKIAGSAGTYGFGEVSELCRSKDREARELLETMDSQKKLEWIKSLPDFLEKVKIGFRTYPQ